ncbi:hypothetical protein [Blastococcus tunisiensis]|uniref:Uncharacterized protein n=1 Tax=Blastococcus tunisiensis TaxID=1798228 RepID=A0A1I2LY29_9ACTN|nr:hypothetical protein [Blastococcus sp. DSM 46838]SFF81941.1 hypothetical protein SAMN05216574_12822 [Blastococcus sp. DSM 46838]
MSSFLIRYDRRTGAVDVTEYQGERGRVMALAGRVEAELNRDGRDLEVVVLSAGSLEELKRTHGRYFRSARELIAGLTEGSSPVRTA